MTIKPGVYMAPRFRDGGSVFVHTQKDLWLEIGMKDLKIVDKWTRVKTLKTKTLMKEVAPKSGKYKKTDLLTFNPIEIKNDELQGDDFKGHQKAIYPGIFSVDNFYGGCLLIYLEATNTWLEVKRNCN